LNSSVHLDVGSGTSQNFLHAWQAWRANPQRPRLLHFVAVCGDAYQNTAIDDNLKPLADELDAQLWGLLPGFHRLVFEGGQVLLTLCIGNVQTALKQHRFEADSVFLDNLASPWIDSLYTIKAIAKLCKRCTVFKSACSDAALQAALRQSGFEASTTDKLQAIYNPGWSPKNAIEIVKPASCIVIGAGLAGAAVASSLARRGWAVTVIDAASAPASGASSLPAGLLVPHTSPDDSLLSRLSRAGVRITLQQARSHLRHGTDWGHTGVLQRDMGEGQLKLPPDWATSLWHAASDWCYAASKRTLAAVGLPTDSQALWHAQAGWVKPAALVAAWLAAPGIGWRGDVKAAQLKPTPTGWQVLDDAGQALVQADRVVLCAGYASQALLASAGMASPNLQAVRGQVTFGLQDDSTPMPPFAVNGLGNLIPAVPTPQGAMWLMGASYERDADSPSIKAQDHADNLTRLKGLLPHTADALQSQFSPSQARGWAGIRCATRNRLPLVASAGPTLPGLWLCTGMGSRGLSFAALCGELLAAQWHGEPLPVESQLARAMTTKI
jgi:tRNA 5-methylaminomethyl-2-thiouridine biosynthesis bifunctional protein